MCRLSCNQFILGLSLGALTLTLFAAGCGKAKRPIVVGSENSSEQIIVAEIVAQHLEHRLQRKVERRLGLGGETSLYQAILTGEVTLYPDYAASIIANILKERPDPDASIVEERARSEMRRMAQLELLDPLGYDGTPVVVVKVADAEKAKIKSLSDAANSSFGWKLGVSYDFQQRADGLAALSAYRIPMAQEPRAMEAARLFPALEDGQVNMISATAADSHLLQTEYAVLPDGKKVFQEYRAHLLVRLDALAEERDLQHALSELSGKISTITIRKLTAALETSHGDPGPVAAAFLAEAGLK